MSAREGVPETVVRGNPLLPAVRVAVRLRESLGNSAAGAAWAFAAVAGAALAQRCAVGYPPGTCWHVVVADVGVVKEVVGSDVPLT
jgi:hypothetical protein